MKFPATSDELRKAGYIFDGEAICRGRTCRERIEFWITPAGKKMPMSVKKAGNVLFNSGEVREPHFASCPDVSDFRAKLLHRSNKP